MRLTPPTKLTFGIATLLLAVGIVAHLGYIGDIDQDIIFWIATAGGLLLWIGSLFNRI